MSPLKVEIFHPINEEWVRMRDVRPTDPPGSVSDNKPNGIRDLYIFECSKDNSKSTIFVPNLE